jgi:hypothetical protein
MPVVPLFGDLYTFAFNFISKSKSPNYDASKWPLSNQPSACNVNIIEYLKQIRHEHGILCKRVARIKNEVSFEFYFGLVKLWKDVKMNFRKIYILTGNFSTG